MSTYEKPLWKTSVSPAAPKVSTLPVTVSLKALKENSVYGLWLILFKERLISPWPKSSFYFVASFYVCLVLFPHPLSAFWLKLGRERQSAPVTPCLHKWFIFVGEVLTIEQMELFMSEEEHRTTWLQFFVTAEITRSCPRVSCSQGIWQKDRFSEFTGKKWK